MSKYHCPSCIYFTNHKPNFERHLNSERHKNRKKRTISVENSTQNSTQYSTRIAQTNVESPNEPDSYFCKYCSASFSTNSSRYRHQSKYCKKNDHVNVNKLVQLLNAKDEQIMQNNDKIQKLEEKIDKLMETVQAKYVNNGTHVEGNHNNVANIQLLNYNKTDYDFLTDNDYLRCFMDNNHCVKKLIEKVHFNPKKPENMNVYISCIKGKYVMVYRDNTWQIRDRQKQIDDLYETNELMLENWYDEYKETYPDIIKSFTRYLKNKTNDTELIRSVKDEILMMLYNKRDMIQE